jgi:hypothetical protein
MPKTMEQQCEEMLEVAERFARLLRAPEYGLGMWASAVRNVGRELNAKLVEAGIVTKDER